MSVALANPQRCLRAVLPVASSPSVWMMDIRRHTGDLMGSFGGDPFGRNRHVYELQAKRDKLPQRRMEVRHLGPYYLFGKDKSLAEAFAQAVANFTENLPFVYEEERENPRATAWLKKEMQFFQSFGNRDNYRFIETERGTEVSVEHPQHLIEQNREELTAMAERNLWIRLNTWAHQSIEAGKAANSMSVEEALIAAQQIQRPDDFLTLYLNHGGNVENWRLKAIAGVAAASLSADFERVQEQGQLDWCRRVLLAAAQMPEKGDILDSRKGGLFDDPKVYAARGLGTLVAHNSADLEVRETLLRLVTATHHNVITAVFYGLQNAWGVDEGLCSNALSLALSLCLRPQKIKVSFYSTRKHILVPIKNSWPNAPRLTADLLEYYFFTNIAMASAPTAKAQAEWREMCGWILDDLQGKRNDQYLDEDEAAAASLIIFVHHNMALFDKGWEHVTLFTDVIEKWIDAIEANADFYSHLLIMLSEAGKSFFPEPTLKWLNRFLGASWHTKELLEEHQNGVRTTELLERIWNDVEGQIRSDKPTLQRFSWWVDQLVPLGIPLASLLQQKLEQRG